MIGREKPMATQKITEGRQARDPYSAIQLAGWDPGESCIDVIWLVFAKSGTRVLGWCVIRRPENQKRCERRDSKSSNKVQCTKITSHSSSFTGKATIIRRTE